MNESPEERKKKEVRELLRCSTIFYHFIEYDFPDTLNNAVFNREKSDCYIESSCEETVHNMWIEGLSLMDTAGLGGISFNEMLFTKSPKRYSFYVEGHSVDNCSQMECCIEIKCIEDTFVVKYYAPPLEINDIPQMPKQSYFYFQDYLKQITERIITDHPAFHKCIENVEQLTTECMNNYSFIGTISELFKMLLFLTYPSICTPHKYYYSCVPPAFDIELSNTKKEISAGGIAAFLKQGISDLKELHLIREWANIHTINAIIAYSKRETTRAAKAAIMARNVSHNLGSHVLAYLKNKLGTVSDIVKQRALADLTTSDDLDELMERLKKLKNLRGDHAFFSENVELPFLVGLGHFISYIQEREDYIATVATSYIPYYMPVNFKDSIYDALNPDLRFLRHPKRKGGRPDNILLAYIAKSEGLERPSYLNCTNLSSDMYDGQMELEMLDQEKRINDIIIKFRDFDGINDREYTLAQGIKIRDSGENESYGHGSTSLDEMKEYDIALPGGISGRQAIFSILENIIRNAAKHGNFEDLETPQLVISLDIYDPQSDNFTDPGLKDFLIKNKYFLSGTSEMNENHQSAVVSEMNGLYILTITDNLTTLPDKFDKLAKALESPYLNEYNQMDNHNKGLKEMRISASWIRRITDEERNPPEVPIIKVRLTEKKHLQYIICIPKALNAAIILQDKNLNSFSSNNQISFLDVYEFRNTYNRGYNVIAIKEEDYSSVYPQICLLAPQRIVKLNKREFEILSSEHSILTLYKKLVLQEEKIYIIDKHSVSTCDKVIQVDDEIKLHDFSYSNTYIYKTHLESEKEFCSLIKELLLRECDKKSSYNPRPLFAEGISGNNSTDRLLRSNLADDQWYYRHLHAMQNQVAIFDERLFYHVTKLNDRDLRIDQSVNGDSLAVINAFKNIYVFNVIYHRDNTFGIYGYDDYILQDDTTIKSCIKLVGTIKMNTHGNIELNIYDERYKHVFNNVSIHQGLLDKIYEQYECDATQENNVVDEFYNQLFPQSRKRQLIYDEKKNERKRYFYPGFTIHSGRSKPYRPNALQLMPFIQYASIENAFMDCKYILVQLLELNQYDGN